MTEFDQLAGVVLNVHASDNVKVLVELGTSRSRWTLGNRFRYSQKVARQLVRDCCDFDCG